MVNRKKINSAGIEYADVVSSNAFGDEQLYPNLEEIVICRVESIAEMGVYVQLLEYKRLAMILLTELSKRSFKSINNIAVPGDIIACKVIRIDRQNSYIDLSKQRVTKREEINVFERFHRKLRGPWNDRKSAVIAINAFVCPCF